MCRESLLASLSTEVSIVAYKTNPGTPNRVILHVTRYLVYCTNTGALQKDSE